MLQQTSSTVRQSGFCSLEEGVQGDYVAFVELDNNVSCKILCHLPIVRCVKLDYFTIEYFGLQLLG